jgi:hypothetical protein
MISDDQLKKLRQDPKAEVPSWTLDPATDKQANYIKALIEDRDVPESWLLEIKRLVEEGLKKGKAGEIISALKTRPITVRDDRSINRPTLRDLPPGRYAVQTGDEENDLTFYRVVERHDINNRERKYKIMLVVAGPREHYISGPPMYAAVKRIVRAGVGDSATLYGKTIGRCSICHTQITNRLSRELGIGPVCGGRVYDDWDSRVTAARDGLLMRGLDPTENVGD